MLNPRADTRWRAARPFVALGALAIIAGGLTAAAVAHRPAQSLVWMSAYLVLVVGVVQIIFGAGQARLASAPPGAGLVIAEWWVFNLGNAAVIAGTLLGRFWIVFAGTLWFVAGIALFLHGTRRTAGGGLVLAYRALLVLILVSSLVGLGLSLAADLH